MKQDLFKAYKDNLNRIREEYPILHEYGDLWAMEVYRQIKEGFLTEFLKTVDPEVTVRQLKSNLGSFTYEISPEGVASSFIKIIFEPKDANVRLYDTVEMLEKFGWYPAAMVVDGWDYQKFSLNTATRELKRSKDIMVIFEPTHDPEQSVPMYLYHITSQLYVDSIDKKGLVPKTHGKLAQHPGRVYLVGSKDGGHTELGGADLNMFARQLYFAMKKEAKDRTGAMVVYRIDTRKVNNLKLLEDPNFVPVFVRGYYTYYNIAPSAMTKIHAYDTNQF
jgi:hypothetical protein